MTRVLEKVTAFITRESDAGPDLLLFEHPYAGVQIPAGTVEAGEAPEQAALREAAEESGLTALSIRRYLGHSEKRLPDDKRIIAEPTKVYARPDVTSFDWANLPNGTWVSVNRRSGRFSHLTYEEFDRLPDPQYVSMCITGWVPDDVLADTQRRHFFLLEFHGRSEERWVVHTDNHRFMLFWSPLPALPAIMPPQDAWLEFFYRIV